MSAQKKLEKGEGKVLHIANNSGDFYHREDKFSLTVAFDTEEIDDNDQNEEYRDPCGIERDVLHLMIVLHQ